MYDQEKVDDFIERSESIAKTLDKANAIKKITSEIDLCEDRYLNEYILALNFVRDETILDWIEVNSHRIRNVSESWGHLTAISFFSWNKAEQWLSKGRPLSLIALDALIYCTTHGERLNQSLMMRELNPRLDDNPGAAIVAGKLQEYLLIDNVPRTKMSIDKIISNLLETEQ